MREEQKELWHYYDEMGDDDRVYIMGMAKFLAARGRRVEKLPALTLVVGGRGGESLSGQPERLQDRIPAFRV